MRKIDWSVVFPLVGIHTLCLLAANVFLYNYFELPGLDRSMPMSDSFFQIMFVLTIITTQTKGLLTARQVVYLTLPINFVMTMFAQYMQQDNMLGSVPIWKTDAFWEITLAACGAYFLGQMIAARAFACFRHHVYWPLAFMGAYVLGITYDTLAFYTIFTFDKVGFEWVQTLLWSMQTKFHWALFYFVVGHVWYANYLRTRPVTVAQ